MYILVYKKRPNCFLEWPCHFTFLEALLKGVLFLPSLSALGIFIILYLHHSNRYIMISHCAFNLLVCNDEYVGHLFTYLLAIHISFFGEIFVKICPLKKKKKGCFLIVQFWKFFRYSGYKSFFWYAIWKYFLPVCGWSFYSLKTILNRSKVIFILIKSNSSNFSFISHDVGVSKNSFLTQGHTYFLLCFHLRVV